MATVQLRAQKADDAAPNAKADYLVNVDGADVAIWSANHFQRGWRLYDIDRRPIRDPRGGYFAHLGVSVNTKAELEPMVHALLEQGSPLTLESLEARRAREAAALARWNVEQKHAIRVRTIEANASTLYASAKGIMDTPVADVLALIDDAIAKRLAAYDEAMANPDSVENYAWRNSNERGAI